MEKDKLPADAADIAENVADYLGSHPEFFEGRPQLLSSISVPHADSGRAVSLIERQVRVLREQSESHREKLASGEAREERIRYLGNRFHELVMTLLTAECQREVYLAVSKGMKGRLSAKLVKIYIFGRAPLLTSYKGLHFMDSSHRLRFLFTELFTRDKPLCDSLQNEHLQALFGNEATCIRSTLLVPMNQEKLKGILVLGSNRIDQYKHGIETDMVRGVADVLGFVIDALMSRS